MKVHSNGFKNGIKKNGKQIDSKITYTIDGEIVELGKVDLNSITPHYQANILKSVMKQLDLDSNVDIPLGTEINYKFGLKVNGEYEYLSYGNYIVYSSEKQEDTKSYKIICYDKMLYSMKPYESFTDEYPMNINNYVDKLCNKLGLVFKNKEDSYVNKNRIIPNELYLDTEGNDIGYTYRDVFDELAQVTASTICINEETDELEIRYINDTEDTIDEEYFKDVNVNFGEKYGPVNTIILSRSADSDKIYRSYPEDLPDEDKIAIVISDNQIMNFNNRDEFLPEILEKLNGLEYYINDYESYGIMYYNVCDKYNVSIGENVYGCIMLNDEVDVTQGLSEKVYCDTPEGNMTDYTKADKTDRRINQTYLIVNKQEKRINAVVQDVSRNTEQISQMSQDLQGFDFTVKDIQENVYNLGNTFQITVEGINGVIDKTGNNLLYGTSLYDLSEWGYKYGTDEQYNNVEIIDNDFTKSNFLSKRAMNVTYTTFKSTLVDKNMKNLTLSMKIQNNLKMGYFNINVNERVENEIINQINSDIYVGDYKNLDKFEITFPITNVEGVSFDGIFQTKPILIGIDEYSVISEDEPEPSRGLYWIKESTDEIKYAKFDGEEFESWELIPWTYTQAQNNPTLVNGTNVPTIPINGSIMIGDVKLEYGDLASDWNLNPNEFYGTNYKITEDGIEFSKEDEKTIHNEEGINVYKNNQLKTQVNSERVFSENIECKTLDVDGLITKRLSSNKYIRFIKG